MANALPWWMRLVLPLLAGGVWWAERRILRRGEPLAGAALAAARRLGIGDPGRVRVRVVGQVPFAMPDAVRRAVVGRGWLPPDVGGMALGHAILLRADRAGDLELLCHELVHVRQYEGLGGIRAFLRCYLHECHWAGYQCNALEAEARALAADLARRTGAGQRPANSGP